MNTINPATLEGKKVLIRVDFNLPLSEGLKITDDSRMIAALPTIKKIIKNKAKAIIISHLGRPNSDFEKRFSLENVVLHLSNLLKTKVKFSKECIGEEASRNVESMSNGEVLVLENLRFHPEEKKGDQNFAKKLAVLGDIYINDAFGVAHRDHASTSIIAQFFPKNKYLGPLFVQEIRALETALKKPQRPFTAIVGGSKVSGKIDVIKSLLKNVDHIIVGGGMAYTFIKAMGGLVGKSLVENDKLKLAKQLIDDAKKRGVDFLLPTDSINAIDLNAPGNINKSSVFSINDEYMGLDIGEASVAKFSKIIANSKTLIWNGPMGVFEKEKFEFGTKKIAEAICLATKNGAFSLVGGGDSVAAIKKFGLEKNISYISTGGGAMLEYIEGKNLPAISAILD